MRKNNPPIDITVTGSTDDIFRAVAASLLEQCGSPKEVIIGLAAALVDLTYGLVIGLDTQNQDECLDSVIEGMRTHFATNQSEKMGVRQ